MSSVLKDCASRAVKLLRENHISLASAESCTGGLISEYITGVSGASEIFELGVASYSPKTKESVLKVKHETIRNFGTVSPETASEMAQGVMHLANSDIGVSVTGVAGPDFSEGHPPGLVYIALSDKNKVYVKKLVINPISRDYVRETAAFAVFNTITEYFGGTVLDGR